MNIESKYPPQINKAIYNHKDDRQNLDAFESSELDMSFVDIVKKQAESVACLVLKQFLKKGEDCWKLTSQTPTLAQVVEYEILKEFKTHEVFGEQEAFCNEYAAGFGTAFLVGKQLAMTAAHCICKKHTNILDEKIIAATYIVFGFQNSKKLFTDKQVYQIKKVVSHQYTRIQDKLGNFTEWTDWALVELDRQPPYMPLKMNMARRIADKTELYMLGHPYGLPVKFVGNGFVHRNLQKDFFESNLDAFGGNSGSPAFNRATSPDPKAVIPALLDAINDKNEFVRKIAAYSLGHVGHADPKSVIPALLKSIKDENDWFKLVIEGEALDQIGHTVPQTIIPHLLAALEDEDDKVRSIAAFALGQVGHADPKAVIPALLKIIKDKFLRSLAAEALGFVGHADPKAVIFLLLEALQDEDDALRQAAAEALGQVGLADPKAVIPSLLKALKDKRSNVRQAVAKALGLVGHADPKAVIPLMLEALTEKDDWIRGAAATALGQIGYADPKTVIPALLEALKEDKRNYQILKAIQKYDLSIYLKNFHLTILDPSIDWNLLTSTPLTALITCYKEVQSQSSVYSAAIVKKCLEENLPIFQVENALCCYEQSKLCTIDFPNASQFPIQMEKRVPEYPKFVFTQLPSSNTNQIQEPKPPTTQRQNQQSQKDNAEKTESCSIQ